MLIKKQSLAFLAVLLLSASLSAMRNNKPEQTTPTEAALSQVPSYVTLQEQTKRANSLLLLSARTSNLDTLRAAIDQGAQIDAPNDYGFLALHEACYHGHTPIVYTLLEACADTNNPNKSGYTALYMGRGKKDHALSIVPTTTDLLLYAKADINYQNPFNGSTPLHHALLHNLHEKIHKLILAGARFDLPNTNNETAWDMIKEKRPMVRASQQEKTYSDQTLAMLSTKETATTYGLPMAIPILAIIAEYATALFSDIDRARFEREKNLLRATFDHNTALSKKQVLSNPTYTEHDKQVLNHLFETQLLCFKNIHRDGELTINIKQLVTAPEQDKQLVKKLLKNRDIMVSKQFVKAAKKGDLTTIKILRDLGASCNEDYFATCPLTAATRHGHLEIIKTLLDAQADINHMPFRSNDTALAIASQHNTTENRLIFALLLDAKADPNIQGDFHNFPKPPALFRTHTPEKIDRLLYAKAQVDLPYQGTTRLAVAINNINNLKPSQKADSDYYALEHIVRSLVLAGANFNKPFLPSDWISLDTLDNKKTIYDYASDEIKNVIRTAHQERIRSEQLTALLTQQEVPLFDIPDNISPLPETTLSALLPVYKQKTISTSMRSLVHHLVSRLHFKKALVPTFPKIVVQPIEAPAERLSNRNYKPPLSTENTVDYGLLPPPIILLIAEYATERFSAIDIARCNREYKQHDYKQ